MDSPHPVHVAHAIVEATYLGGPTAFLRIGGVRLLTDPTFDPPGDYELPGGRRMTKHQGPALPLKALGRIDAVLLSHDQHMDNLDVAGRAMLADAPTILTTVAGALRLGPSATPMPRWTSVDLPRPDGGIITVTSVPAQHGPPGTDHLTGEVTGFMLRGDRLPTIYVSGDNASLPIVEEIAERLGPVDVALLFAGAAQTALIPGENLTLSSADAARAIEMLGRPRTLMLHFEGWAHFTEGRADLSEAFARVGLSDLVTVAEPGNTVHL